MSHDAKERGGGGSVVSVIMTLILGGSPSITTLHWSNTCTGSSGKTTTLTKNGEKQAGGTAILSFRLLDVTLD